ncbi:hypothetical protein WR25_18898 [Diploscapter pachys]|uniref:Myb-like domain-containing protein n=1 Tax=Diploscapter pachys TaxID=2018661 RepID=A0A2A2KHJ2_9BILA|nr:hypothetical protein WR25_18898 [Diploscapter pachys]
MTPKVLYEFPEDGIYTEEGYPFHHLAIGFRYKAKHLARLKNEIGFEPGTKFTPDEDEIVRTNWLKFCKEEDHDSDNVFAVVNGLKQKLTRQEKQERLKYIRASKFWPRMCKGLLNHTAYQVYIRMLALYDPIKVNDPEYHFGFKDKAWTIADERKLYKMVKDEESWIKISEELKRPVKVCKNQFWKLKQAKFNPQVDPEPRPERKRKPRTKKEERKKSEDLEFESDLDRPLVKKEKLESEKKPRGKSKGALSGASQLRICSKEFVDTDSSDSENDENLETPSLTLPDPDWIEAEPSQASPSEVFATDDEQLELPKLEKSPKKAKIKENEPNLGKSKAKEAISTSPTSSKKNNDDPNCQFNPRHYSRFYNWLKDTYNVLKFVNDDGDVIVASFKFSLKKIVLGEQDLDDNNQVPWDECAWFVLRNSDGSADSCKLLWFHFARTLRQRYLDLRNEGMRKKEAWRNAIDETTSF